MTLEGWWTLAVVAGMTGLLARERLGADLVLFLGLCALVLTGVLDTGQALAGFADRSVATIGVLFVVAAAVKETGALRILSHGLLGRTTSVRGAALRVMVPTAAMSAFVNNTPIIALMIPAVRDYARRVGTAPSKLLIPLAYAAMLGGTCTLIGTSANLVVSGMLQGIGEAPLGMFELTAVGLPTALVGLAYMATAGVSLLPVRGDPTASLQEGVREYLSWVDVADDSPLVGQTIEEAGLRGLPGLYVVEIKRRGGEIRTPVHPEDVLCRGDRLVLAGIASTVRDLRQFPGLVPTDGSHLTAREEESLVEVVVSRRSPLLGLSVRDAEFRRRYGAAILAVHRAGERLASKIGDVVLQEGDTLLLTAEPGFAAAFRDSTAFDLVSEVPDSHPPRYRRASVALAILAALVVVPVATGLSMLTAAMGALIALVATGCISPRGVRAAVNFPILVLVGSAFGIATALVESGAAGAVAGLLAAAAAPLGPVATLGAVYAATVVFVFFVGNAAGAAIMFPIALSTATAAGLEVRPFAIATALAASAAFATPIGYQNLLVYGPGGYRYRDFLRVGLPLNVLCLIVVVVLVPWLWPLTG